MKCNQHGCGKDALYAYTWPGKPLAGACEAHAEQLVKVSEAMGFYLQMIPIAVLYRPPITP